MNTLIAYRSGTRSTEVMADAAAQGVERTGKHVDVVHVADQPSASAYDYIIFGCPAMGAEVLEESEFEPFFMQAGGALMNKKVAPSGSYGWGSGERMQNWEERVEAAGANLSENGLIINYTPNADGLDARESLGERSANVQKHMQIIRSAFCRLRKPSIKSFLYSYLRAYFLTIEN